MAFKDALLFAECASERLAADGQVRVQLDGEEEHVVLVMVVVVVVVCSGGDLVQVGRGGSCVGRRLIGHLKLLLHLAQNCL